MFYVYALTIQCHILQFQDHQHYSIVFFKWINQRLQETRIAYLVKVCSTDLQLEFSDLPGSYFYLEPGLFIFFTKDQQIAYDHPLIINNQWNHLLIYKSAYYFQISMFSFSLSLNGMKGYKFIKLPLKGNNSTK